MKNYYEAYDERYKTVHGMGFSWSSNVPTPIVERMLKKYGKTPYGSILEIGCGEGRDAKAILEAGYPLFATDVSPEAVAYCQRMLPEYRDRFAVLDCVHGLHEAKYDFIYAVAVIHMLVTDADRDAFYRFLRDHLNPGGVALVCSMGDGKTERKTDISEAFDLQERRHGNKTVLVASTSCRMIAFTTFEAEIARNGLQILEQGVTPCDPDFNLLMYAVVKPVDDSAKSQRR